MMRTKCSQNAATCNDENIWLNVITAIPVAISDFVTVLIGGWSNSWRRRRCFCDSVSHSNWMTVLVGGCRLQITTPSLCRFILHQLQWTNQQYRQSLTNVTYYCIPTSVTGGNRATWCAAELYVSYTANFYVDAVTLAGGAETNKLIS